MTNPTPVRSLARRREHLAGCVATAFVIASPFACATSLVSNCNDSGDGSLRSALDNSAEATSSI